MAKREEKTVVSLPKGVGPTIHPNLSQAARDRALAYTAGMQSRQQQRLPKVHSPVAGGPAPSIPHLAGSLPEGTAMTMEEYAKTERGGQVQQPTTGGIVQPDGPAPASRLDIRPGDLLPDQAKSDSKFRHGHGSMYAASQPELAAKYGVVRGNQVIPPQRLQLRHPGQAKLRPETLKDLQALAALEKDQGQSPVSEPTSEIEEEEYEDSGGKPKDEGPGEKPDKKTLDQLIQQMDGFDLDEWRDRMMTNMLNNPEQKKIIESRLEPLDITELIVTGYIRQRIPIVPGKYEITLQTYDGMFDLALKRLIMQEAKSLNVNDRYLMDKYAFYGLTVCLHKINDKVYPDCVDEDGNFSDELFIDKFNQVIRLNIHILASIGANITWFEQRVRTLCRAEKLGNG